MDGMTINHIVSIDHGSYGESSQKSRVFQTCERSYVAQIASVSPIQD